MRGTVAVSQEHALIDGLSHACLMILQMGPNNDQPPLGSDQVTPRPGGYPKSDTLPRPIRQLTSGLRVPSCTAKLVYKVYII